MPPKDYVASPVLKKIMNKISQPDRGDLSEMAAMLMSVSDEHFIDRAPLDLLNEYDEEESPVKQDLMRYLNRVMDRNKPLFLFNTKHGEID